MSGYERGNGENTIDFLKYLQALNRGKRLIILWDNASYHRSQEVRDYLAHVNQGLPEKNWKLTCLPFAPYAPQQNPVEDIWLKGKNFLRRHFFENKTFMQLNSNFFKFLDKKTFNFKKPSW
jgi:transposase